jgi:hypothetical protein
MVSPIIICNGVIRSGSTWSFNVCRLLGQLLARQRGEKFGSIYLEEPRLTQFLEVEIPLKDGVGVIKCHALGPMALEWIRTGKAKAVCTFRDPRDCVASDMSFWGKGFEESVGRVWDGLRTLASYDDFGRTLFVRYEEMMHDRPWQIRQIAAYLNIPVDQKEVAWIDSITNIQCSRSIVGELPKRKEGVDTVLGSHRRDRVTLLHDNHISSGKAGRWKEDLTAEQGQFLIDKFAPMLQAMGYETRQSINAWYPAR